MLCKVAGQGISRILACIILTSSGMASAQGIFDANTVCLDKIAWSDALSGVVTPVAQRSNFIQVPVSPAAVSVEANPAVATGWIANYKSQGTFGMSPRERANALSRGVLYSVSIGDVPATTALAYLRRAGGYGGWSDKPGEVIIRMKADVVADIVKRASVMAGVGSANRSEPDGRVVAMSAVNSQTSLVTSAAGGPQSKLRVFFIRSEGIMSNTAKAFADAVADWAQVANVGDQEVIIMGAMSRLSLNEMVSQEGSHVVLLGAEMVAAAASQSGLSLALKRCGGGFVAGDRAMPNVRPLINGGFEMSMGGGLFQMGARDQMLLVRDAASGRGLDIAVIIAK